MLAQVQDAVKKALRVGRHLNLGKLKMWCDDPVVVLPDGFQDVRGGIFEVPWR